MSISWASSSNQFAGSALMQFQIPTEGISCSLKGCQLGSQASVQHHKYTPHPPFAPSSPQPHISHNIPGHANASVPVWLSFHGHKLSQRHHRLRFRSRELAYPSRISTCIFLRLAAPIGQEPAPPSQAAHPHQIGSFSFLSTTTRRIISIALPRFPVASRLALLPITVPDSDHQPLAGDRLICSVAWPTASSGGCVTSFSPRAMFVC
jgi:hypothetical protein